MVKTKVFKKIAALTAAVAMIGAFAASASAVVVTPTTTYTTVDGQQKVNVVTNVSELGGAVEVTYYASKNGNTVYVDQKTANASGEAQFDYVTDTANYGAAVKVSYTNAAAAEDVANGVPSYTISGTGITSITVPTGSINGEHNLAYTLASGQVITGVTATAPATVSSYEYNAGTLTVVLANATGDVVLTVATGIAYNPTITCIDAAAIVSTGVEDEIEGAAQDVHAALGQRKVSVLAQVADATEYGIIISAAAIEAGEKDTLPAGAYAAKGNSNGYFAVQVIDTGDDTAEDALIQSGVTYNTAVYYRHPNTGKYFIVAGDDVVASAN